MNHVRYEEFKDEEYCLSVYMDFKNVRGNWKNSLELRDYLRKVLFHFSGGNGNPLIEVFLPVLEPDTVRLDIYSNESLTSIDDIDDDNLVISFVENTGNVRRNFTFEFLTGDDEKVHTLFKIEDEIELFDLGE